MQKKVVSRAQSSCWVQRLIPLRAIFELNGKLKCAFIRNTHAPTHLYKHFSKWERERKFRVASVWYRKILIAFSFSLLFFVSVFVRLNRATLRALRPFIVISADFYLFICLFLVRKMLQAIFPTNTHTDISSNSDIGKQEPAPPVWSIKIIRKLFQWLSKRNSLNDYAWQAYSRNFRANISL